MVLDDGSQLGRQLPLPVEARSEAPTVQGSGLPPSVSPKDEHSGTGHLMERVAAHANLEAAMKRVMAKKGSAGADGMPTTSLPDWYLERGDWLREQLLSGSFKPTAVRRVEIPKPDGGVRELGIPTVVDRLVQQAVLLVLQPLFDPTFSTHSYGFRPGRSAHDALRAAQQYVADDHTIVVDVDLEKFFDRVNHDVLMGRLAKRIEDKRLLGLIRGFLKAGIMLNGVVIERYEGTPQGGPLSPLLANFLLDEVDKELEARGHAFVRYADDCNVYVKSQRAGERVMMSLKTLFGRLRLRINESKSGVAPVQQRVFLGVRIVWKGKEPRWGLAAKTKERFKNRIREITGRSRGRSLKYVVEELRKYLVGWRGYFRITATPSVLADFDGWIRRRLRCLIIKQRRRHEHSWWALSRSANFTIPDRFFDDAGLPRLLEK